MRDDKEILTENRETVFKAVTVDESTEEIRENIDFSGTPIIIQFKNKGEKDL